MIRIRDGTIKTFGEASADFKLLNASIALMSLSIHPERETATADLKIVLQNILKPQ
jgi:hypothetical protein